jgi:hypothetical protein
MLPKLQERFLALRVEIGAIERIIRELGATKQHLRLIADLMDTLNSLERIG